MNGLPEIRQRGILPLTLRAIVFLVLFFAFRGHASESCLPPTCSPEEASRVTIEQNAQWNATIYSISCADCTVKWIAPHSEPGLLKNRSACSASLSEQLPLWEKICAEIFRKDNRNGAFHILFWGGLEPEKKNGSREMSIRLALAAYQSREWDSKAGKSKNGDINGFIKNLADSEAVYSELKELFRRFDREIKLACVEKVRVLEAGKLPFYDKLRQKGVKATDRLPFDCMVWFSISTVSHNHAFLHNGGKYAF